MAAPDFTPKQQEVLQQVRELLSEHFDSSFLAVQSEAEDDDRSEIKTFYFNGGMSACIGLARIGLLSMERDAITQHRDAYEGEAE